MTLPIDLVGAWRRSRLLLNGVRTVDYCDVIWLQTPEWFVDIRLLIDPKADVPTDGVPEFFYKEFAFAGITTWTPPVITWDHRIDSNLEPGVDSNPIVWTDGVVRENGTAPVGGRMMPFTEEWLRMTDDDVAWTAEPGEKRARTEVGRFAVEIEDRRHLLGRSLPPRGWGVGQVRRGRGLIARAQAGKRRRHRRLHEGRTTTATHPATLP